MTVVCERCDGTGIESSYTGTVVHPMYGSMKVKDEKRWPLHDLPGGTFYGGSGHWQCRTCKGKRRIPFPARPVAVDGDGPVAPIRGVG